MRCLCDNEAVVAIIKSGTCKNIRAMHFLQCLFFFTAYYQLHLEPVHLPGRLNCAADSLSRNNLSRFLQLVPSAHHRPTCFPEGLLKVLVLQAPDWTSEAWKAMLHSTLLKDLPAPP